MSSLPSKELDIKSEIWDGTVFDWFPVFNGTNTALDAFPKPHRTRKHVHACPQIQEAWPSLS